MANLIALLAAAQHLGEPVALVVRYADGSVLTFGSGTPTGAPAAARTVDDSLGEADADVIDAAREAARTLSARELARLAGYTYNSQFRSRLGRLANLGHLERRNPGYGVPGLPIK